MLRQKLSNFWESLVETHCILFTYCSQFLHSFQAQFPHLSLSISQLGSPFHHMFVGSALAKSLAGCGWRIKVPFITHNCAVELDRMSKTIAFVTLLAVVAVAAAAQQGEAHGAQKMVAGVSMSANPLHSFQTGCQACGGAFPST